ncbi:MAG: PilX N-terminal domain-containing pilus assembly protein, partial [Sedimenticola sp.]|nr:PilX N-terminal domain-containing pilus assembly protein [Sedimenticola sp.]
MLLIMTILGLSSMQTTTMEEKMAGAIRDKQIAFQAGEVALREGEDFLTGATLPAFNDTGGLYSPTGTGGDQWQSVTWSASTEAACNCKFATGSVGSGVPAPRYIIEELPEGSLPGASLVVGFSAGSQAAMYQVTARGAGKGGGVAVLQTTYLR